MKFGETNGSSGAHGSNGTDGSKGSGKLSASKQPEGIFSEPDETALLHALGALGPRAAKSFERRLARDPDLAEEAVPLGAAVEAAREWIKRDPPGMARLEGLKIPRMAPRAGGLIPRARRRRPFEGNLRAPGRGAALAPMSALALVLTLAVGYHKISRPARTRPAAEAACPRVYSPGSRVLTRSDGHLLIGLNSWTQAALDGSSTVELASEKEALLERGAMWLKVTPGGEGYIVRSTWGSARVTGTSFGVRLESDGMTVEVIEGSVSVEGGGGQAKIHPGERVKVGASGLGAPGPRSDGLSIPAWVEAVAAPPSGSAGGAYSKVPSIQWGK